MLELGLAIGLVALLAGGTVVVSTVPWESQLWGGVWLVAVGLGISVPAGFWYHVRLWRALSPRGVMHKRWWLFPTREHPQLLPSERGGVLFWFRLGAAGFGVALLGCALMMTGALRAG